MRDLSIVVVSFNTVDLLRACLESVFAKLGELDTDVFVVDNGSTDGSPQMVTERFPCVNLIRNIENRGFAAANNQVLERVQTRYVLLLNSDTVVLGSVLQGSTDYLDAHPDVGILGCRVLNADRSLQLTCSQEPNLCNLVLLTSGLWRLDWPRCLGRFQLKHWGRNDERDVPVVSGCYLMARKEAIQQVGLLDEDFFFFGEETDWCRRFRDVGVAGGICACGRDYSPRQRQCSIAR